MNNYLIAFDLETICRRLKVTATCSAAHIGAAPARTSATPPQGHPDANAGGCEQSGTGGALNARPPESGGHGVAARPTCPPRPNPPLRS